MGPIQRLILIFFMEATTVLDIIMEATMATLTTDTTARDLLMLSLLLLLTPRQKLTPGMDTMVDMVLDTMVDTTVDTMAVATHTMATVTAMATTGASKKGVIKSRADGHEVPAFLTTTCPMFSISEKNQNVQNKTSSFFKHTAFKHLYILYIGTYGYLLRPLEPQERTRNVWF